MSTELLKVKDLKQHFPLHGGILFREIGRVFAVDGVSVSVEKGETLGLVGESGCGKTTLGRSMIRLYRPTAGEIIFDGLDITRLRQKELRGLRREMQMIFQDPFESLNSRHTVGEILEEPFLIHKIGTRQERQRSVAELLERVGLSAGASQRYPHEFSGGQRQRIGIARAIALKPKLIVCDEPVSALDVSIQAQIINLLEDLRESMNISYLFISHDLSVVKHISHRVVVMYLGTMVETADKRDLYSNPTHPYTQALLSSIPIPNPAREAERRAIILEGEIPSPVMPPSGCKFHPRCSRAEKICSEVNPGWLEIAPGHAVACHKI